MKFQESHHERIWHAEKALSRIFGEYKPRVLFLADGGVWNNLGTQSILEHQLYRGPEDWDYGGHKRHIPKRRLLVINASAPVRPARLWRLHLPGLAEFASLSRSVNILTFNTVVPRAEHLRKLDDCAVVDIADGLDRALRTTSLSKLKDAHPEDAELVKLSPDFQLWDWSELRLHEEVEHERLAGICRAIPTTLGRIDRGSALRLLIHGYQNTQVEVFVKFGYPRVKPRPGLDRFLKLVPPTRWDRIKEWLAKPGLRKTKKVGVSYSTK